MKVRIEKTEDYYKTAKRFWDLHNFPNVHISFLPQKVFVVSNEVEDLYCMFFYETDSSLAYLAYPISNLEVPKEKREGAFQFLLDEIEKYALKESYYLLYTTSPVKPVQDALLGVGYSEGDVNVTQYLKQIG
jgi:hypothetical protein